MNDESKRTAEELRRRIQASIFGMPSEEVKPTCALVDRLEARVATLEFQRDAWQADFVEEEQAAAGLEAERDALQVRLDAALAVVEAVRVDWRERGPHCRAEHVPLYAALEAFDAQEASRG